jgi:hypothetical protein
VEEKAGGEEGAMVVATSTAAAAHSKQSGSDDVSSGGGGGGGGGGGTSATAVLVKLAGEVEAMREDQRSMRAEQQRQGASMAANFDLVHAGMKTVNAELSKVSSSGGGAGGGSKKPKVDEPDAQYPIQYLIHYLIQYLIQYPGGRPDAQQVSCPPPSNVSVGVP